MSSPGEPRKKPRRCPMCGTVNRPSVQYCECGHDFDEAPAEQETFLRGRVVTGWAMVIAGFLLTIIGVVLIVVGIPIPGSPSMALWTRIIAISLTGASLALFVKGTRVVDAAGHSLRDLRALPTATLVERDRSRR